VSESLEVLMKWLGKRESAVDHITIPAVHRLAATLDRDDPMPKSGDVLPYGWHLILFPRVVRQSQIGPDGHPERGDFLPPVPLPRRMFAGRRIEFHADLLVGDELRRDSIIKDVRVKNGHSGEMVFVTLKAEIHSPRGLALTEEHDIVYRGQPDPQMPSAPTQPSPGTAIWKRSVMTDPVLLFRMSALCFNGHRIHYDFPYVTNSEGYPDLIVPAGVHTTMMFELLRANTAPTIRYKSISWRNVKPLFVNKPFTICGQPSTDGGSANLWVLDHNEALALSAHVEFE
jgi:3-methylfumaryl-CoA hydratase